MRDMYLWLDSGIGSLMGRRIAFRDASFSIVWSVEFLIVGKGVS